MVLGKVLLCAGGTLALAAAYTFHEGLLRVDSDKHGFRGSHVHVWVPAAVVPMAIRFVPKKHIQEAAREITPWFPTGRILIKELKKYPEADLIEVDAPNQHVHVRTHAGALLVDQDQEGRTVHIACPVATLQEIWDELETSAPGT